MRNADKPRPGAHVVVITFEGKLCLWCPHCFAADDVPLADPSAKRISKDFHKKHKECKKKGKDENE